MGDPTIRVFIGTSDANRLEQQVLISSIRRHASRPVDIYLLNGDSGLVTGPDFEREVPVPKTLNDQYVTRFTAMRFAIPDLCGRQGAAVYLDSDQIVFDDIAKLADALPEGTATAAVNVADTICGSVHFRRNVLRRIAPKRKLRDYYLASVLVMDTARCDYGPERLAELVGGGLPYMDLIWLGPLFREAVGLTIADLDPRWNSLDQLDADTRLVHFTAINTQPWLYSHYTPTGRLWLNALLEEIEAGSIDAATIRRQHELGRLSWSNLQRALARLEGRPANALATELYDAGRAALCEAVWHGKGLAFDLLRRRAYWNG